MQFSSKFSRDEQTFAKLQALCCTLVLTLFFFLSFFLSFFRSLARSPTRFLLLFFSCTAIDGDDTDAGLQAAGMLVEEDW
jgi:hypothetical protein